jgi:hypothetical protein
MKSHGFLRRGLLAACAGLVAVWPASAQTCDSVVGNKRDDGTIYSHSVPAKLSAGSAQLGNLDLGPSFPPCTISGIQGAWLEWNTSHVYLGLIGGGLVSAEVFDPGGSPIPLLRGAATLNGGFIATTDTSTGCVVSIRPCLGSFLWTPTKLYLMALGGGIATAEVTDPGGGSIMDVQGVTVLVSSIFDYSTTPCVTAAHIVASALVYTPTNVYHVDVDLSGGIAFATTEVFDPAGLSITKTRGINVTSGAFDFSGFPPLMVHGAALLWNDAHVYLIDKTPLLSTTEVLKPTGTGSAIPIAGCWGIMTISRSFPSSLNPPRHASLVWQTSSAWVVVADPTLSVSQATLPPGTAADPPLVSDVTVPTGPPSLLIQRQAGQLYEILASMLINNQVVRSTVIGVQQRLGF